MCGFLFTYAKNNDLSKIREAERILSFRGTDSLNHYENHFLRCIHSRLSIRGGINASQPLVIDNHGLVFNGEIYNCSELSNFLGKSFEKDFYSSDTHLLFWGLKNKGEEFVKKIFGHFSFVFFNLHEKEFIAGRDSWGEKPLYLFKKNIDEVSLASSPESLASWLSLDLSLDFAETFMQLGYVPQDVSIYPFVEEVPSSSIISFKNGKFFKKEFISDFKDISENTFECLKSSVKLQSSDLKDVSISLSGGIDSSLIAAILKKDTSVNLNAINVFSSKDKSSIIENKLAKKTSKNLGLKFFSYDFESNFKKDNFLQIQSKLYSPIGDPSLYLQDIVFSKAKDFSKVIFSGIGADELFTGYPRHKIYYLKIYYPKLYKVLNKIAKFIRPLNYKNQNIFSKNLEIFSTAFTSSYPSLAKANTINSESIIFNTIEDLLAFDRKNQLKNQLIMTTDQISLIHGVEVRSPYLSKSLEFLADGLDFRKKINFRNTKLILREYLSIYNLGFLISQPKRGFSVNLDNFPSKENLFSPKQISNFKELLGKTKIDKFNSLESFSGASGLINFREKCLIAWLAGKKIL